MESKENMTALKEKLSEIEKSLKETVTGGLEIIKADPYMEKEVLTMFITPAMTLYEHFLRETKRTGTETVGKNVIKYTMFKKL